jgi:hypothetical protein
MPDIERDSMVDTTAAERLEEGVANSLLDGSENQLDQPAPFR